MIELVDRERMFVVILTVPNTTKPLSYTNVKFNLNQSIFADKVKQQQPELEKARTFFFIFFEKANSLFSSPKN